MARQDTRKESAELQDHYPEMEEYIEKEVEAGLHLEDIIEIIITLGEEDMTLDPTRQEDTQEIDTLEKDTLETDIMGEEGVVPQEEIEVEEV